MKDQNRKSIEILIAKIEELNQAASNAAASIKDESNEDLERSNEDSKIWDSVTNIWFIAEEADVNLKRFLEKYK